jgi:hypothetical protein
MKQILLALLFCGVGSASAWAQAIPPPTNPVTFCGTQATPAAVSYQYSLDSGPMTPLTMDTAISGGCLSGTTHSFKLAAALFTVGNHQLVVRATNTYGSTNGPVYTITVGIAPGPFTIISVIPG